MAWPEAGETLTYRLERSSDGGDNWAMLSEGYTTSYDESVGLGEYLYRVRAQNPVGNSDWQVGAPIAVSVPNAPAAIDVPAESPTGQFMISWTAADGAESYTLERSDDDGASWTAIYNGTALSREDTVGSGIYLYRVRAHGSLGSGEWRVSEQVVVGIMPDTPASINYPDESATGFITVSWPQAAEADIYRLERSDDNGATWTELWFGEELETDVIEGSDGLYLYRVRAENDTGSSEWRTGHELLVMLSEIEAWRRQNFDEQFWGDPEVSGPMADPNNDGFNNFVNFALRGDPNQNDSHLTTPRMTRRAQVEGLAYSFRVRRIDGRFDADSGGYVAGGVIYVVKTSDEPGDCAVPSRMDITEDNTILEDGDDGPMLHVLIGEELKGNKGFASLVILLAD